MEFLKSETILSAAVGGAVGGVVVSSTAGWVSGANMGILEYTKTYPGFALQGALLGAGVAFATQRVDQVKNVVKAIPLPWALTMAGAVVLINYTPGLSDQVLKVASKLNNKIRGVE